MRLGLNATARVSPRLAGRLALEVWRRPWGRGPVRPGERAVHESAVVGSVVHRGRPVVTYRWGDGRRPVLLVHGWRARASRWATLVDGLVAAGLSPVAYDAPGHGATDGRVVTILDHEAIMRRLAARHGPFEAVVGHSFGVALALYAVRSGLTAERVVAISGMGDFGYLVDGFCAGLQLDPPVAAALRRAVERAYFEGDPDIWRRFSVGAAVDGAAAAACDVLVVHDVGDEVVDPAQARLITAAHGERATYLETEGLGHGRILDAPEVVGAVVRFVDRGRGTDG